MVIWNLAAQQQRNKEVTQWSQWEICAGDPLDGWASVAFLLLVHLESSHSHTLSFHLLTTVTLALALCCLLDPLVSNHLHIWPTNQNYPQYSLFFCNKTQYHHLTKVIYKEKLTSFQISWSHLQLKLYFMFACCPQFLQLLHICIIQPCDKTENHQRAFQMRQWIFITVTLASLL